MAGTDVLDVGCGPGTITAEIAGLVAPGSVLGLDRSADVVAVAARDHGAPNLAFAVGDVHALDQPDAAFDVVHAHQVLQHLADPVAALAEMRRVCRPGGVVAVRDADDGAMAWWPDVEGLHRWLAVDRAVARVNGGEPDAGRRLAAWARAAGFDDVEVRASMWCFAEPGDRAWWAEPWAERIAATSLADRAVALGVATRAELDACAGAWRAWAADDAACFLVPHVELLARGAP